MFQSFSFFSYQASTQNLCEMVELQNKPGQLPRKYLAGLIFSTLKDLFFVFMFVETDYSVSKNHA